MKSKVKKLKKNVKKNPSTTVPESGWKNKEVLRILNQNLKTTENSIQTESIPFIKTFISNLLTEAEETTPAPAAKTPQEFTPEGDKEAFNNALDEETPENTFDVQGIDPANTASHIEEVKNWTQKLDEFVEFINSPTNQNLHKALADYDRPGSLLRGITRKTSDGITRVAGEIAKLRETLNGFLNMAGKKQRDLTQNQAAV